jgi:hypothetical protein
MGSSPAPPAVPSVLVPAEAAEFDTQVPHWFGAADPTPTEMLTLLGLHGEPAHLRARTPPHRRHRRHNIRRSVRFHRRSHPDRHQRVILARKASRFASVRAIFSSRDRFSSMAPPTDCFRPRM